jgi:hypothetical protein
VCNVLIRNEKGGNRVEIAALFGPVGTVGHESCADFP